MKKALIICMCIVLVVAISLGLVWFINSRQPQAAPQSSSAAVSSSLPAAESSSLPASSAVAVLPPGQSMRILSQTTENTVWLVPCKLYEHGTGTAKEEFYVTMTVPNVYTYTSSQSNIFEAKAPKSKLWFSPDYSAPSGDAGWDGDEGGEEVQKPFEEGEYTRDDGKKVLYNYMQWFEYEGDADAPPEDMMEYPNNYTYQLEIKPDFYITFYFYTFGYREDVNMNVFRPIVDSVQLYTG